MGSSSSARETVIDSPPSPPNPKFEVADEQAWLQGTMRSPNSSLSIAPRPLIIGSRTLFGRYTVMSGALSSSCQKLSWLPTYLWSNHDDQADFAWRPAYTLLPFVARAGRHTRDDTHPCYWVLRFRILRCRISLSSLVATSLNVPLHCRLH